jgi:hypothetical protein
MTLDFWKERKKVCFVLYQIRNTYNSTSAMVCAMVCAIEGGCLQVQGTFATHVARIRLQDSSFSDNEYRVNDNEFAILTQLYWRMPVHLLQELVFAIFIVFMIHIVSNYKGPINSILTLFTVHDPDQLFSDRLFGIRKSQTDVSVIQCQIAPGY